jgi:hypothetical protein
MIPVENGRGQGFLFRMSPNQIIGPRILSFGTLISSIAALLRYLRLLRYRVLPRFGPTFAETYATDALAFVKRGAMTAPLPFADLVRSTAAYALPQIGIVRPKMVLCLGSLTFAVARYIAVSCRANLLRLFVGAPTG